MKSSRRSNPAEAGVVGEPIYLVSAIHSAIFWKRWSGFLIEIFSGSLTIIIFGGTASTLYHYECVCVCVYARTCVHVNIVC